jgi:hypothetical protein
MIPSTTTTSPTSTPALRTIDAPRMVSDPANGTSVVGG